MNSLSPGDVVSFAPTFTKQQVVGAYRGHVNSSLAGYAEMLGGGVEVHSEGCYVLDEAGNRYLDCGGFNVFFLGHRHPRVVEAVRQQLDHHPLATRLLLNGQFARAAEKLASVAPAGLQFVWLANSGAEAVEAGLKLAWLNGCQRLIAMEGAYHGNTLGALSVTGKDGYRVPFQQWLAPVSRVPFGNAESLRREITCDQKCCVILEPIQSEGGVVIPPAGYLKEVQRLCRQHDALLMLDEVSTGLGRVGCWWAADREEVTPDVLLAGKALSGGVMPVSAAICSPSAYAPLNANPLLHTSTFAGNPLAAVAALTTIEVIEQEGLVERSRQLGERLLGEIRSTVLDSCRHLVRDVRGAGLLIAIEFEDESRATRFIYELLQRRVISSHSLNAGQVVRLTPPAVMKESDVQCLLGAIEQCAQRMGKRFRKKTA